jgi:putative transposase
MFIGVKFKLYPNEIQKQQFEQNCGNVRFVYNYFLDKSIKHYKKTGKTLSFFDMTKAIVKMKKRKKFEWLKLTPGNTLYCSLRDLTQAYSNFFANLKTGRAPGFPKFKSKNIGKLSFKISQACDYTDEGYLWMETIGWVKCRNEKGLERLKWGKIKSITVSKDCGEWYASCLVECEDFRYETEHTAKACGIDLGVNSPITIAKSNGNVDIIGKQFSTRLAKIEKRRRKQQKALARKQKASKNKTKQKLKVAKLYRKERNVRKDWIEKTSYHLVTTFKIIKFEDLNIQRMTENKGEYKKKLNHDMLRMGHSSLITKTIAKAKLYGSNVILVDPRFTSQRCSECGSTSKDYRKGTTFHCSRCGNTAHADKNAARNILTWAKPSVPTRGREFKAVKLRSSERLNSKRGISL